MKIGIVGAGLIVEVFLEAVKRIGALRPEAICVREGRMDRALELSEKYGIRTQYTDYAQMLNDPEIDFVYIALPNRLHYGYAAQALKSHVNVLVEKPAVLTAAEFKELARLAEENRLFLFECITTVHLPNFQDIKKGSVKSDRSALLKRIIRSIQAVTTSSGRAWSPTYSTPRWAAAP